MTRLGYQIPNFTYPGVGPAELFDAIARQAVEADGSGFDTVLVMDHFFQLPMIGPPENYMLECYTTLGALARETETVRLGALVTGNTYRNPTLLAKAVTALDVVSGGRAQLGIGAGWFELEHDALGYEFGTFTDRFEKLEEALQIIGPMLRDERPTFAGAHYSVTDAINQPPPIGAVPIMIGGAGEKKTLRMAATYATDSNLICAVPEIPHKLDVLAGHLVAAGRDRADITVTHQVRGCIAPTHDEAYAELRDGFARRGIDLEAMADDEREANLALVVWGDPDEVGEALAARLALGVDGFTINLTANGHIPGRVELLGQNASSVLAAS